VLNICNSSTNVINTTTGKPFLTAPSSVLPVAVDWLWWKENRDVKERFTSQPFIEPLL
jgi:hypothetical protein